MKSYALILTTLLVSCGTAAESGDKVKDNSDQDKGGIVYQPEDPKEVVVEYRKDGDSYAITVADTKDLPVCEHENSKQLAWVKTSNQFFSCENESWVEIPMEKPKDGLKGEKGDPGEDGKPVTANQWFDPVTSQQWLIGAVITEGQLAASNPCSNGWSIATKAEVSPAVQHGLLIAAMQLQTIDQIWTADFTIADHRIALAANGLTEKSEGLVSNAGIACLKD